MTNEDLEKLGDIVDDSTVEVTYEPTDAQKLEALLQKAIDNGADLKLTPLSIPDYVNLVIKGSPWHEQLFFGNHDFACALFGERQDAKWLPHDVPAKRKDFRPWKNKFNIDYGDWAGVPDELYNCLLCNKSWGKSFTVINDSQCEQIQMYNPGFKYHLQQAVSLPIPSEQIDYFYKAVFGDAI